jgi:hypothetical protein
MGDSLKTFFSSALVRRLAADIARVHPGFPIRAFTKDAAFFFGRSDRRMRPTS